jgi:hypothetical protein
LRDGCNDNLAPEVARIPFDSDYSCEDDASLFFLM